MGIDVGYHTNIFKKIQFKRILKLNLNLNFKCVRPIPPNTVYGIYESKFSFWKNIL